MDFKDTYRRQPASEPAVSLPVCDLIPPETDVETNNPFQVVLGRAYRGLTGGFLLLWNFSVTISVSPHVCFILV